MHCTFTKFCTQFNSCIHKYILQTRLLNACRALNYRHTVILMCAFNFSMLGRVWYRSSKYPAKEDYILIANS